MLGLTLDLNPSGLSFTTRDKLYSAMKRYFTKLDPAFNQHYTMAPWTATGDFEIKCSVYWDGSSFKTIVSSAGQNSWIRINNSTLLSFKSDGVERGITVTSLPINQLFTLRIVKAGDTVSAYYGDTFAGANAGAVETNFIAEVIGVQASADNYFNNVLANVSLDNFAGDKRFYKLDEDFSSTTVAVDSIGGNNATAVNITSSDLFTQVADGWEGVELWTLPLYVFTGGDVSGGIPQSANILTSGLAYRTTFVGSGDNVGLTTGLGGSTRALIGNQSVFADGNPFSVTSTDIAGSVTAMWQVNGTAPFSGEAGIESVKQFIEVA